MMVAGTRTIVPVTISHRRHSGKTTGKGETQMPKGGTKRAQLERSRRIKEAEAKRKAEKEGVNVEDTNTNTVKDTKNVDSKKSKTVVDKNKKSKEKKPRKKPKWLQRMSDKHKSNVAKGKKDSFYRHRKAKLVATVAGIALMVLASGAGVYGLVSGISARVTNTDNWTHTGTIAANIMGDNVMEDTITEQIMSTKKNYTDDTAWAQYLVDNDKTPSSLRESTISQYKSSIILKHALEDNNLSTSLTQTQIDQWRDENKETYENHGMTKNMVPSYYSSTIQQWALKNKLFPKDSITDQDILDYINENESTYNGARKSKHILFATDTGGSTTNKDQAESAREQIVSGETTFDDAVNTYSTDTGTKEKQGDVGWDSENSLITEYETALKALSKGDISQVTQSSYGYHIIQCTDVFEWEGTLADINAVPDEIKESVRSTLQTQKFSEWYTEYTNNAQVTINDMPSGLPYDVSLDGITKSENANNSTSTATTSSDGTATVTATSDASDSTEHTENTSTE